MLYDERVRIPFEIFSKKLQSAIYTMTGFNVEHEGVGLLEQLEGQKNIAGTMVLAGKKNLVLVVTTNTKSAKLLVKYMTGIDGDELDENDLSDGLAEFANVVAGTVKTELKGTEFEYNLTSSFAITGDNLNFIVKKKMEKCCYCFKACEVLIKLEVFSF